MGFINMFHHQFGIIFLELGFQASNMQIQDMANRPEKGGLKYEASINQDMVIVPSTF